MKHSLIILILILIGFFNSFAQVNSIDTLPVYKIIPDILIKGGKDSNGLRQGVFYEYNDNGTINSIRTYVNDTLNGFLGRYSPKGFVNSEQFYKNGEEDSLWFDYYEGNKIEAKGFYKNGLKHGIFLEFYPNGNLKLEGYYQNDTLVGNEIYYYDNKIIHAIGNKKNGIYKTFYTNGEVESILFYENYLIAREQLFCQRDSKQIIIKEKVPTIYSDKKLVSNKTELVVEELFSNYTKEKQILPFIWGFNVCLKDSNLIIYPLTEGARNTVYKLTNKGIQGIFGCVEYDSKYLYNTHDFSFSFQTYIDSNNEESYRLITGDSIIIETPFTVVVHEQGMKCDDTGNNSITIEYKNKKLQLLKLHNICMFEFDANKDGLNEVYIISYESCVGLFKILRIMK